MNIVSAVEEGFKKDVTAFNIGDTIGRRRVGKSVS